MFRNCNNCHQQIKFLNNLLRKNVNTFQKCHNNNYSSQMNDNMYESEAQKRVKREIEESKKSLQWRDEVGKRSSDWNSKFKLFSNEEQNMDYITLMQQPIDLSPAALKKWWKRRQIKHERFMQQYIPDRHRILGSDLATAHFLIHRGGSIKFLDDPKWHKADENGVYVLPKFYDPKYKVEAIKCDNMELYFEGLDNVRVLHNLKFWSLRNCKTIDDFCLDRISGSQNPILEVLDLTGTSITYRGLSCIYRLENLKLLIIDNPNSSKEMELSCAMLESEMPKLSIKSSTDIHDI